VWFLNVIICLIVDWNLMNMVLREIFGGEMERLTGGWGKL
jgi:hypothetical protein